MNGSPRGSRSQTLRLVRAVLDGARDAGAEVEFVDICKLDIGYCRGCLVCYERGECVRRDDFPGLYQKMLASDGIVLGSPNYINSVTAQIKTMLDRMGDAIHCQFFLGKYGCAVSTAGGSRADEVVDYLNDVLQTLGANTVGGVGVILGVTRRRSCLRRGGPTNSAGSLCVPSRIKRPTPNRRGTTPRCTTGCGP